MTPGARAARLAAGEAFMARLKSRRVLVLSPHMDDAAICIGGLLLRIRDEAELTALTIFGRSAWTKGGIRTKAWKNITALRRAEDLAFFRSLNAKHRTLELPDTSLRGYAARSELGSCRDTASWVSRALSTIEREVKSVGADVVLSPAAIGGHVDHVLTMRAARRYAENSARVELAYYQDLPYAFGAGTAAPAGVAASRSLDVCLSGAVERKSEALAIYASQLSSKDIDAIALHAVALGGGSPVERLWKCS